MSTTLLVQYTFNGKQLERNNKKVIVNQLNQITSIGLSHLNKNDCLIFAANERTFACIINVIFISL